MQKNLIVLLSLLAFLSLSSVASANSIKVIDGVPTDTIFDSTTPVLVTAVDLDSKTTLVKQNGIDVGKVSLQNKIINGNLMDCDIVSCDLVLNITPLQNISLKGLRGVVLKSLSKQAATDFEKVKIQKLIQEPIYETVDDSFDTLVLNKTTGKLDNVHTFVFSKVQKGTKDVLYWVDLDDSEVLVTGNSYLVKLVFNREYLFGNAADLSVSIFGYSATSGALDPWWNTTFANFINFTVDTTATGNLTDFPVYISFDGAALIAASQLDSQCYGLRVLDKTDSVQLAQELENGTCNTANTTIWVKLPIASSVPYDNEIHLYYNNQSAVASASNGSAVFSNNFTQVIHLGETSGNFGDSSPSGWSSVSSTNITRNLPSSGYCKRGGCVTFGATTGNINFSNVGAVASGDKLTVEYWINSTDSSQYMEVYGKLYNIDLGKWQNKTTYAYLAPDQIWQGTSGMNFATKAWGHQAVSWTVATGSSILMYWNASTVAGSWVFGSGNIAPAVNTNSLQLNPTVAYIGVAGWTGSLDEVRRASQIRSADWIKAEYAQTYSNNGNFALSSIAAYTSNSTTPANLTVWSSGLYVSFNVSWDNVPTAQVFNIDGVNVSVTPNVNYSTTKFGAGYHTWYSAANNSGGANQTPTYGFYLQPANGSFSLLINGSASDLTMGLYNASNVTVLFPNTAYSISIALYRNGSSVQLGTIPLQVSNYSQEIFEPQTVNWTAIFTADGNYTGFQVTRYVNVVAGVSPTPTPSSGASGIVQPNNNIVFEGEDTNPALENGDLVLSLFGFLGVLFVAVVLMPKKGSE